MKKLARELGVADQTLYNWKSKNGGMEVLDAKKLRALEDENRRLKEIVADLSLDREVLKAVIPKTRMELVNARRDVTFAMAEYRISERQACRLVEVDRTSYRYDVTFRRNQPLSGISNDGAFPKAIPDVVQSVVVDRSARRLSVQLPTPLGRLFPKIETTLPSQARSTTTLTVRIPSTSRAAVATAPRTSARFSAVRSCLRARNTAIHGCRGWLETGSSRRSFVSRAVWMRIC